jgi:hypothetical protein
VAASRNRNNGKFKLLITIPDSHELESEFDEGMVNSDMETQVRELRDQIFPKPLEPEAPPAIVADEAPLAAAPEPEVTADPFPPEATKSGKATKSSR